jgi:hypothetical protein
MAIRLAEPEETHPRGSLAYSNVLACAAGGVRDGHLRRRGHHRRSREDRVGQGGSGRCAGLRVDRGWMSEAPANLGETCSQSVWTQPGRADVPQRGGFIVVA